MLTLTNNEKNFLEDYKRLKNSRAGYWSDDDIEAWFSERWSEVINGRRARYLMDSEALGADRSACKGCCFIGMKGQYPCDSCPRGKTDHYIEVTDENIKLPIDMLEGRGDSDPEFGSEFED